MCAAQRQRTTDISPLEERLDTPEFIEKLKAFDNLAWDMLKTCYAGRLRTFILGALIHADLSRISVQDVEQDVWLTAIKKITEFQWQAKGLLYLWLRSIANNVVRNHIKTYRRAISLSQSNSSIHNLPLIDPPSDPPESGEQDAPEHQLEATKIQLYSELELIGINSKHIEIYLLYKIDKQKPREIARKLDMPAATIRMTVYRIETALTNSRNRLK